MKSTQQEKLDLLEEIEREVIGNEEQETSNLIFGQRIVHGAMIRNNFRASQRRRLSTIINRVRGGKCQ